MIKLRQANFICCGSGEGILWQFEGLSFYLDIFFAADGYMGFK